MWVVDEYSLQDGEKPLYWKIKKNPIPQTIDSTEKGMQMPPSN